MSRTLPTRNYAFSESYLPSERRVGTNIRTKNPFEKTVPEVFSHIIHTLTRKKRNHSQEHNA